MILHERRASAILFNLLRSLGETRPFILPGNICSIVPETFRAAGQPFVMVDIADGSLEIDGIECSRLLRSGACGGIVFVHPYGSERDVTGRFHAFREADPELVIIDDRCLCAPDPDGSTVSPLADVTLFSTGYAKYADLSGGGFAHTGDAAIAAAYRRQTEAPAWLDVSPSAESWEDYRARIASATHAAAIHKKQLNGIYASMIPAEVCLPPEFQQWRFNIRVPRADELVERLFGAGLFASRHYPPLGEFPIAARVHATVVNLFNDRYFTEAQALQASAIVAQHVAAHGR